MAFMLVVNRTALASATAERTREITMCTRTYKGVGNNEGPTSCRIFAMFQAKDAVAQTGACSWASSSRAHTQIH
jgi:hypothetical protein